LHNTQTNNDLQTSSRSRIRAAAIEVFAEKGRFGARMEEIAKRADINKAMLYYYYGSKENLYREVLGAILKSNLHQLFTSVGRELTGIHDPAEMIRLISSTYFRVFSGNPSYTKILFEAVAGEPGEVRQIVSTLKDQSDVIRPERILEILEQGIARKVYRDIDPKQILVSIIGMNLIYFLARPIASVLLDLDDTGQDAFLDGREKSIIEMLLYGVMLESGDEKPSPPGRVDV
jgi:TetR/AcrR family transcriptional regulator